MVSSLLGAADAAPAPTRPHVLVLNRWYDDRVCYPQYLDHQHRTVSYIAAPGSERHLRAALRDVPATMLVTDLADRDAVYESVDLIERSTGRITGVVALSEYDLVTAAYVRERIGVPGTSSRVAVRTRDKVEMKRIVSEAGVPVPRYVRADDDRALRSLVADLGFPLVVKPRLEAGSDGVEVVATAVDLERVLSARDAAMHECEEYLDGRMFHADGLVADGEIRFLEVFQYVNHPILYFQRRIGSGAVAVDDARLVSLARSMAHRIVAALGIENDAFHLEFFVLDSGDFRFLEIGARIGGGPIRQLLMDVHGLDIARQHVRLQLGDDLEIASHAGARSIGGYLMIPEPTSVPFRVTGVRTPRAHLETLYHEMMPEVGTVLNGTAHDLNLCGLFLYRGNTTADVLRDVGATLAATGIEGERLTP